MIPQELIQQWEKDAEEHASIGNKKWSLDHNSSMNNYIAGRRAQYLQMQAENERLKGLLEDAFNKGIEAGFDSVFDGERDYGNLEYHRSEFKKQHKL